MPLRRRSKGKGRGKDKTAAKQVATSTDNNKPEQDDSNDTSSPSPSGKQQQQQQQTPAVKEEAKEKEEETPRAEEEDVTKDDSNTGPPVGGKEKRQDATGDVATAEGGGDIATERVVADDAAVGTHTAKEEEKEKEVGLEKAIDGGPKEDKRVSEKSSPQEGGAGEKIDDGAGGGGAAPVADAGTKIEERADAKPEPLGAPGKRKLAVVAQEGEEKGVVEKEPPIPAGGGAENDSSDEDDGDGFRIVVGREVAPPAAPTVPTKRFLRGTNSLVNTNTASAAGAEESRSTPAPKPISAAAGIASLVPSKGAPVASERPSLKPGQYPPTAELQQSTGKTAFDVDIDGMEEQPWRHPGVDIADFFNYGFTEDSWRVYCEKQLRNRYDRTLGRSKNTLITSSRGGRSSGHMRYAGGGGRRGGDRPGGAERPIQLHNNTFRQQGPAGKPWGGAGPGPERFAQGFGSGPPPGHGSSSTPWFDGPSQMRPKGRQNFGPGSAGGQGREGGHARQGNGNAMGGSAGARRSRSPDPRAGPSEKMARLR